MKRKTSNTVDRKEMNNRGFTLIEVLIAMAIFSVGILGVAALHFSSSDYSTRARTQTEGASWAAVQMEQLMALPYNANNDGLDNDSDGSIDEADEQFLVAGSHPAVAVVRDGIYDVTWNIQDDTPVNNTKTITVSVRYLRQGGKTVRLQSVKADII